MPIRLTRIYTRTGDKGDTALVGGRRVAKDSPRIEAYGTVDELNAIIGLARVFNAERLKKGKAPRWLDGTFRQIQNELFDLGSELATPDDAVYEGMHRVGEAEVKALEALMDQCQKDLQPLKSFTLPGGGRVGGFLHQARTVCRRAERRVLALSRVEPISPWTIAYVNRLSDLLFVLSRWVARKGAGRCASTARPSSPPPSSSTGPTAFARSPSTTTILARTSGWSARCETGRGPGSRGDSALARPRGGRARAGQPSRLAPARRPPALLHRPRAARRARRPAAARRAELPWRGRERGESAEVLADGPGGGRRRVSRRLPGRYRPHARSAPHLECRHVLRLFGRQSRGRCRLHPGPAERSRGAPAHRAAARVRHRALQRRHDGLAPRRRGLGPRGGHRPRGRGQGVEGRATGAPRLGHALPQRR